MRIAVFADVHGNLPALEAVLDDAQRAGANAYLAAGDFFINAPFALETLAVLQQLNPLAIRGNHEEYLLEVDDPNGAIHNQAPARWGTIRWAHQQLGAGGTDYARALPQQTLFEHLGCATIHILHGSPQRCSKALVPDHNPQALKYFQEARLLPENYTPPRLAEEIAPVNAGVLICGHTHIPWQQQANDTLVVNPGAVGLPIHGSWQAQYALLTWEDHCWQVTQRSLPYDRERVRKAYHTSGLLEQGGAFARACLANVLTGQAVGWFLIQHMMAWCQARGKSLEAINDAEWHQAAAAFPWQQYGV
jgi:predicted phosphodiesterase